MNRSTTRSREHDTFSELLPWYVNGTLEGPQLDAAEAHFRSCPECAGELAVERRLAHMLRTSDELAFSAARGLEKLRDRLDDSEGVAAAARGGSPLERWRRSFAGLDRPVRWTLAAQAAALILLVGVLLTPGVPRPGGTGIGSAAPVGGEFQTLSEAPSVAPGSAARLRVVFDDDAREGDVRALLSASGVAIVDGPTAFGVYTLAVGSDAEATGVLETLRSSDLVAFVEPLR